MPEQTQERPRPNGGAPKTTPSHQPSATPSVAPSATRLEAALDYLARAWGLLPLRPGGKEPFGPLNPTGWEGLWQHAATTSDVERWFELFPDIKNIGIFAGEVSQRLSMVDIDFKGNAVIPDALREYVESLNTPVVWTPNGGLHIYAKSGDLAELKDFHETLGATKVELKARKTYVVAPPSVLTSGTAYRWAKPLEGLHLASVDEVLANLRGLFKQLPSTLAPSSKTYSPTAWGKQALTPRKPASKPKLQNEREALGLEGWDAGREFVEAVKNLLGISVCLDWERGTSSKFCCVLHEESNPSARLFRTESGVWAYADYHQREGRTVYPLVDVYARVKHRVRCKLTRNQRAAWKLRLLADVGILKVRPGDLELPQFPVDLSPDGLVLLRDFALLLALKWSYRPEWRGDPSTFARRFAAQWCGLPERRFDNARRELLDKELLVHVGSLVKGKTKLLSLPAYTETGGG